MVREDTNLGGGTHPGALLLQDIVALSKWVQQMLQLYIHRQI